MTPPSILAMTEPSLKKSLADATVFFTQSAPKLLTVNGRLQAESLLVSVGRMSGSLLFRSYGLDKGAEPGTVVLFQQANADGAQLMEMMLETATGLGQPITQREVNLDFADPKRAEISFRDSLDRLAPFYLKYCETAPIGLRPAAMAAARAAGVLMVECAQVLPVRDAAGIAIYGLMEGCKTVPWPLNGVKTPATASASASSAAAAKPAASKPWYKLW